MGHTICNMAWASESVHKVRHARGEGVQEGVTVCDRGGGPRARDVTLTKSHTYET